MPSRESNMADEAADPKQYSEAEARISAALHEVWSEAEEDWPSDVSDELSGLARQALSALGLPWVPIQAGARRVE
jgi:hypothetical protein